MARKARIKLQDDDAYYHITNRIAGMPDDLPFGTVEKQHFTGLIKKQSTYFTIDVLGYCVMSNHYHISCQAPVERLTPAEAAKRYNAFYPERKCPLEPDDPKCLLVAEEMRDISKFIGGIQQQFSAWFNREHGRRGTLWAGRFKNVLLERDSALWNALFYIEMNPVRAKIVPDPAMYQFSTWGEWNGTGRHPYGDQLLKHLMAYEGAEARAHNIEQLHRRFRVEFARVISHEAGALTPEIEAAMKEADTTPPFLLCLDQRVKYWADGLIIGSREFIEATSSRLFKNDPVGNLRLQKAVAVNQATEIYAYRRLRS